MLALAHRAMPHRIGAATVDHGLRSGAQAEARAVAEWCAAHDVPHAILPVTAPPPVSGRQAWARARRYDLLARHALQAGAPAILTAHHADDQAETFLMRANRGVGLAGLRGIPASGEHIVREGHDERRIAVLRPLLGWRRDELASVAAAFGMPVAHDPSNDDPSYERVRVRRLLATTAVLDPAQLARTAAHLAEADAEMDAMRAWLWNHRRVTPTGVDAPDDQIWLDIANLPREFRRRLAREAIGTVRALNGITPAFDLATNIEPLLDALERGRAATQAGVLVAPKTSVWHFAKAPPRRS